MNLLTTASPKVGQALGSHGAEPCSKHLSALVEALASLRN